jgi:hemerythrin
LGHKKGKLVSNDFAWKNSHSVGHTVLDEHHQQLFGLCIRAINCIVGSHEHKDIHEILNDLVEFVRMHDAYEESLLKISNFPLLDEHVEEHRQVMAELLHFIHDLMTGSINELSFADYLCRWLKGHVLISDMKYQTAVLQIGTLI